jgi:hypothetical protein
LPGIISISKARSFARLAISRSLKDHGFPIIVMDHIRERRFSVYHDARVMAKAIELISGPIYLAVLNRDELTFTYMNEELEGGLSKQSGLWKSFYCGKTLTRATVNNVKR